MEEGCPPNRGLERGSLPLDVFQHMGTRRVLRLTLPEINLVVYQALSESTRVQQRLTSEAGAGSASTVTLQHVTLTRQPTPLEGASIGGCYHSCGS